MGGPRAILSDGETGVFCQPRDVGSLEAALLRVVSDQAFRNRLGQNAARHVRSRWLFDKVLLRMRHVYDELIREVVPGVLAHTHHYSGSPPARLTMRVSWTTSG